MKINITLNNGNDIDAWKQQARNKAISQAAQHNVNWLDLNITVILPLKDVLLTKGKGHNVLVTQVRQRITQ
jgi:hypothetical protein